jgi:cupin fold WbuC family metalloprotein
MVNILPEPTVKVTKVTKVSGSSFKLIDQDLINSLSEKASISERLRHHYTLHKTYHEKVQRFLNVMQVGTYIRPHRHQPIAGENRFELFVVLQGSVGILLFDECGEIIHQEQLNVGGTSGIELCEDIYHTAISLSPNTVILEIKEGPYEPKNDKEFLSLFPKEGTLEAAKLVKDWESYFNNLSSL